MSFQGNCSFEREDLEDLVTLDLPLAPQELGHFVESISQSNVTIKELRAIFETQKPSALEKAVIANKPDLLTRTLIEEKAHLTSQEINSAFFFACRLGHFDTARQLLAAGADANMEDGEGQTSLFYAALKGDVAFVKLLIQKQVDVNKASSIGVTPLMLAVASGKLEMVKLMLKQKADIDKWSQTGLSAINMAVGRGNTEMIILLMNAGASLESVAEEVGVIKHLRYKKYKTVFQSVIAAAPHLLPLFAKTRCVL